MSENQPRHPSDCDCDACRLWTTSKAEPPSEPSVSQQRVVRPTGVVCLMASEQPNQMNARQLAGSELRGGYTVCACGKYAHIFRAEVLRRLPDGYDGELCGECHLWMCAVDKLTAAHKKD